MNKDLKLVVDNSFKKKENKLFFEKKELKNILDLYAKMVSKGSWKDYGLHISSKRVSFSVFKNAAENALYKICKSESYISILLLVLFSTIVPNLQNTFFEAFLIMGYK